MSKAPPFDPIILERAKAKFIEELQGDIQVVQQWMTAGKATVEREVQAKLFHKIKGASGFLGLSELEAKTSALVTLCRSTDKSAAHESTLIDALQEWVKVASLTTTSSDK